MPHPHRWFLLVILFALGVLLASCAEEFAPCPDIQVGVMEGYVRVLGEPALMTVKAGAVEDGLDARLSVATDSTGFYRMILPSGSYRIVAEHESSRASVLFNTDTPPLVEMGPLTRRWDLDLGRVDVAFFLPDSYEGHRVQLELLGDPGLRYQSNYRPVEAGRLAYCFSGVYPGTYELSLDWNVYGMPDLRIPFDMEHPDSTGFEVGTEAAVVREFDFRSTAAVLAGNVGGGWREVGVDGVRVQAIDGNFDLVAETVCDAAGDYNLQLPLAVPVTLRAYVGGSYIYYGGSDASDATVLELQPGEERTGLDMIATGFVVRLHGPGDQSVYDGVRVTMLDASRSVIATWSISPTPPGT